MSCQALLWSSIYFVFLHLKNVLKSKPHIWLKFQNDIEGHKMLSNVFAYVSNMIMYIYIYVYVCMHMYIWRRRKKRKTKEMMIWIQILHFLSLSNPVKINSLLTLISLLMTMTSQIYQDNQMIQDDCAL